MSSTLEEVKDGALKSDQYMNNYEDIELSYIMLMKLQTKSKPPPPQKKKPKRL